MKLQITIIGLGQIGSSVGMALADHGDLIKRVGYDRDQITAFQSLQIGALDHVSDSISAAIQDSDLVLLSLPIDQIKETFQAITGSLKDGAVIMDTGPLKEIVSNWSDVYFPTGCSYIGLTPVLNPAYLHEVDSGLEAARNDLFQGSLIAIVSLPTTPAIALKQAADLTRLLGASPIFIDPVNMDTIVAATHTLPQLMAAALLNATTDQPFWREGSKVAGREYAEVSGPIVQLGNVDAISSAAIYNCANMVRTLDCAIASLQAIRNDIQSGDIQSLEKRLKRAREGREEWWDRRQSGL